MPWEDTRHVSRTYECNGEAVRFFRTRRGWTQLRLAEMAGYSERVVRKAEAGETLNAHSIEDLADALSTPDHKVHPEDLVCDPRRVVRQFLRGYALVERQAPQRAQHVVADDIKAVIPGDPNVLPFSGQYDGRDGLARHTRSFFSMFERTRDDFLRGQLVVEGKRAVYMSQDWVRLRHGGPEWRVPFVWCMEVDRGQVVSIQSFYDTHPGVEIVRRYGAGGGERRG